MSDYGDPEPLGPDHRLEGFNCDVPSLDVWLTEHTPGAGAIGSARTFVVVDRRQQPVVGYHALTVASIAHAEATAHATRGMPRHPIPAVLLARLAVDHSAQGIGLGAWLLRDAMLRALNAAEHLGIRILLVHAINDHARRSYQHLGFEPSPADPLNLQLLIKDLRASLNAAGPRAAG